MISKHISIYCREETSIGLILEINAADYQKIMDIKTSYRITILNRYGFLKLQYLFSKYFIFLLGGIFFGHNRSPNTFAGVFERAERLFCRY